MQKTIIGLAAIALSAMLIGSADAQTLKVMSWEAQQAPGSAWWDKTVAGFEAAHPGVKIETNYLAFPQYLPTLTTMAASDSLPDVFYGHVKVAEFGRSGTTIDYKKFVDKAFLDQFYPGPLRQFTFGDSIYALPATAQIFGLFYNDAILKQLDLKPAETWDDLIAMTPKIREAGLTPIAMGNLEHNNCPDFFLPLISQYGGDVYALDDLTKDGISWNSKPVIDALTLLQKLSKAGVFLDGVNGISGDQGRIIGEQGKALAIYIGSWAPTLFDQEAPKEFLDNYSVHKVPAVTADGVHYTGDGSGEGWAINAKSANRDLALEFVKYMFQDDVYDAHIEGLGGFPSKPSAADKVTNTKVQEMMKWMDTDGTDHILFGAGSWDAVSNVCQAILDGSIEPAAGAAQIEADVLATRKK